MRRALALFLGLVLLAGSSGCASLFDKEVYFEEPYELPAAAAEPADAGEEGEPLPTEPREN